METIPVGPLTRCAASPLQPETRGLGRTNLVPLILTLKAVSMLLGHCQLLQQKLLPHAPSLKSPSTSDVSPFPPA